MTIEYSGTGAVRQHYGPRLSPSVKPDPAGSKEPSVGNEECIEWNFTYDNLPSKGNAGADAVVPFVPAGALVTRSYGFILTDLNSTSGTTTVDIGLQEADGTEIDNDGLIVDIGGAADGSNAGAYVGAGADIGTVPSATANGYLTVTPSVADLTAGKVRVLVYYIPKNG